MSRRLLQEELCTPTPQPRRRGLVEYAGAGPNTWFECFSVRGFGSGKWGLGLGAWGWALDLIMLHRAHAAVLARGGDEERHPTAAGIAPFEATCGPKRVQDTIKKASETCKRFVGGGFRVFGFGDFYRTVSHASKLSPAMLPSAQMHCWRSS